jgi:ATP synthase protein I
MNPAMQPTGQPPSLTDLSTLQPGSAPQGPSGAVPARGSQVQGPAEVVPASSAAPAGPEPEDEEPAFKPLTAEEAQALRARLRPMSPWRVVAVQAGLGVLAVLVAWLWSGNRPVVLSALYGAVVAVVPAALMAWALRRAVPQQSPGSGVVRFMWLELVKILVSVLLLAVAPKLVQQLNWLALLGAMVLCMKGYVLALLWRRHASDH